MNIDFQKKSLKFISWVYTENGKTKILEEVENDVPTYFGSHHEMRSMNIDALFGGPASASRPAYSSSRDDDNRSTRRWGTKFRFNKRNYDEFKEDNNFKSEF